MSTYAGGLFNAFIERNCLQVLYAEIDQDHLMISAVASVSITEYLSRATFLLIFFPVSLF